MQPRHVPGRINHKKQRQLSRIIRLLVVKKGVIKADPVTGLSGQFPRAPRRDDEFQHVA